jgi:hypothetical protein
LQDIVVGDHVSVEGRDWFVHQIHVDHRYIAHLVADRLLDGEITLKRISLLDGIVGISA